MRFDFAVNFLTAGDDIKEQNFDLKDGGQERTRPKGRAGSQGSKRGFERVYMDVYPGPGAKQDAQRMGRPGKPGIAGANARRANHDEYR